MGEVERCPMDACGLCPPEGLELIFGTLYMASLGLGRERGISMLLVCGLERDFPAWNRFSYWGWARPLSALGLHLCFYEMPVISLFS